VVLPYKYPAMDNWTYVRYCRNAMAQKLFSTDPGMFFLGGGAERKEKIDGLDRTFCEMVLGKNDRRWPSLRRRLH